MIWIDHLGWALGAAISLIAFGFILNALLEREGRAALVASALAIPACAGWFLTLTFVGLEGLRAGLILGGLALNLILATLVVLPLGEEGELLILGEQEQVDERDIIFARARYRPGTAEYEDYYARHPELKEVDDRFRALPELGAPGGRYFDPWLTPLANASFAFLQEVGRFVDGEVGQERAELNPAEMARRIKRLARYLGAELVGIAELERAYIYSHVGRGPGRYGEEVELNHRYAIVIAVEMDWRMVRAAPSAPTLFESSLEYVEAAKIALILAEYIRSLGHPARAHIDANYQVMPVPLAWKAGLGELGRLGYLITPRFGPRVRLSVVTTTLPLEPDRPISFGVQDFCRRCRKCSTNCPSGAIPKREKTIVRGVEKWVIDRERCYTLWRAFGTDCALCMRVCPYGHPAGPIHSLVRWAIRRSAVARQMAVWLDDLFYGRRPHRVRATMTGLESPAHRSGR